MSNVSGTIEAVSVKPRKTKFGMKDTYALKIGPDWFNAGFKDPGVGKGQEVELEYVEGTYGKAIKSVKVLGGTRTPSTASKPSTPSGSTYSRGVFPIPPLDGSRSIVRQNALTNARELVECFTNGEDLDTAKERIIEVAKYFERYTAGDMDLEEVQKEIKGKKG